jgi:hypothetical protein
MILDPCAVSFIKKERVYEVGISSNPHLVKREKVFIKKIHCTPSKIITQPQGEPG